MPALQNPENPSVFSYELRPGDSLTDTIILKNNSDGKRSITVYPADSFISSNGNISYKTPEMNDMQDIGKWITFRQENYDFEPGETKFIDFTINIPEDAEKKEYTGGITYTQAFMAEEGGSVNTTLRKVEIVKLKVTDNPENIEKKDIRTFTPTPFFWVTTGIAVLCVLLIIYDIKTKK
jgi:hypothetical protein